MAAATASLNNYLIGNLGLTSNALATRINEQGLFVRRTQGGYLTSKNIRAICQHLCKPGGVVLPNPAYEPTYVVPGILPTTIPDVGIQVSFVTESEAFEVVLGVLPSSLLGEDSEGNGRRYCDYGQVDHCWQYQRTRRVREG